MADTFIDDLDWLPDELITSTKFNQWWANMQNFHNGTALGDGIIVTRHLGDGEITAAKIANRTRQINFPFFADDSGGAVSNGSLGRPSVAFSGTPSGFARGGCIVPLDYVSGTDVVIRLRSYASNDGTHTHSRYVNSDTVGDSVASLWDVDSNVQVTGVAWVANIVKDIDITVAASHIVAGGLLSIAWKIDTAITGNIFLQSMSLRYTADS